MEDRQLRHLRVNFAREGKLAKLATLPKEEEYQNLDIRTVWKNANFANSLSLSLCGEVGDFLARPRARGGRVMAAQPGRSIPFVSSCCRHIAQPRARHLLDCGMKVRLWPGSPISERL